MEPLVDPLVYSYDRASSVVAEFEQFLRALGIASAPGSPLDHAMLVAHEIADQLRGRPPADLLLPDARDQYARLIGVAEFAGAVLAVRSHPDARQLTAHLRLLAEASGLRAGPDPLQTTAAPATDRNANKLFELLIACFAMRCGTDVALDAPDASEGDNPDVLVTVAGRRWGFACKALHSTAPQSVIKNVQKGLDQIDASPADVGVVLVSPRNVLDRAALWPTAPAGTPEAYPPRPPALDGAGPAVGAAAGTELEARAEQFPVAFPNEQPAVAAMVRQVDALTTAVVTEVGEDAMRELFDRPKAVGGFAYFLHGVTGVLTDRGPSPTSLKFFRFPPLGLPAPAGGPDVLACLNDAAHHVLRV
ncbi:hypothetical protein [Roseisolibacter agri]|uniref:Uncharacterized protein n=1 Tax=Roseisolibacter agri TaxID=2014610 RepID=A0AA37VGC7_9BACT|nr:hypothetical protein [Roseisolibacter agri]GLC28304.1 hypothetical protein rosag_48170 [Roseisolibacter agri]